MIKIHPLARICLNIPSTSIDIKEPSIIFNIKHLPECTKQSFRGRWVNGKNVYPSTFIILPYFLSFSSQIIHLKNVDVYTF